MRKTNRIVIALALLVLSGSLVLSVQPGEQPHARFSAAFAEELPKLNTVQTTDQIRDDLKRMFPQGTPKKYVEDVLTSSGAVIQPHEIRPNVFHYAFPPVGPMRDARAVTVIYDANDELWQMSSTGTGIPIFPRQPPKNREDATIFDFKDYESADDLVETLRAMFPLDTPRAEVEKVLVRWARAQNLTRPEEPHHATYSFRYDGYILNDGRRIPEPRVWNIKALYTKDDALVQFLVDGSPVLGAYTHDREYYVRQYKKRQGAQKDESESTPTSSE